MVYLYGEAQVDYQTITLTADYIELSLKNQVLHAAHMLDTAGVPTGIPHFQDGDQSFDADSIHYNFKSKKGKILHASTQESGGNIKGEQIKKVDQDTATILYIKKGSYETLEQGEEYACFSLQMRKMKLITGDKVITGPGLLYVENIPTPLFIPFGIFPAMMKGRANGLIIPRYGNSPGLGFFLSDGGYYTGLGPNADLAITGDIYTRGSWALDTRFRYKKRYGFSGTINMGYAVFVRGDEDFGTLNKTRNYKINWSHTQDRKANPYTIFSANVNMNNSGNYRNNINSSIPQLLSNTFKSSVSLQKPFPGKPYNLSINGSHTLNTVDSTVAMSLPQSTFTVNRFYPGKWLYRNSMKNKKRFVEQIGVSYMNQLDNRVTSHEDSLFTQSTLKSLRAGMKHSATMSVPFKFGKSGSFINRLLQTMPISGNLSYTDIWSPQKISRTYYDSLMVDEAYVYNLLDTDTTFGFNRFGQMSMSASANTKVYTTIMFPGRSPLKAIRHVLTPSVSYSYSPNWTFNGDAPTALYTKNDASVEYSPYANSIYGTPRADSSMALSFGLMNNLEVKVRDKEDTLLGTKKIKLIERLSFNASYNVFTDSMKLSTIRFSGNSNLIPGVSLRVSGTIDPYQLNAEQTGTINKLYATDGRTYRDTSGDRWRLGRLELLNVAASFQIREDGLVEDHNYDGLYYVDWSIPWSLGFNYNFRYSKPLAEASFTNSVSASVSVKLTENWNLRTSTGYDFVNFKPTISSVNITRNLNCWNLTFSTIPFGSRQSYTVNISAKPQMLSDMLKATRRRNFYDR